MEDRAVSKKKTDAAVPAPEEVLLSLVPEDKRGRAVEVLRSMTVTRSEMFSGPLPPPSLLKGYEDISPGFADRIMKMAESQSAHRIEIERKAIGGQVDQSRRGQTFGFIIALVFIATAFCFAYFLGMKEFAATFLCVTMIAVVGVFVTGKMHIGSDLKKKSEDRTE